MYLNYEPVIPLQGTYPKEAKIYAHTKTHDYTAPPYITAINVNNPNAHQWVNVQQK